MAVFLYVPFPKSLVDRSGDGYIGGTLTGFLAAQDEAQLIYASNRLVFTKSKPSGEDPFVTNVKVSARITEVFERLRAHDQGDVHYAKPMKAGRGGPLSAVSSRDILFVVGHSSFTGGYLSLKVLRQSKAKTVVDRYQIRVDTLARQLQREGLGADHRYIKLNSCYGGGSDELDRALARDLATELAKLGYGNVKVGGYQYLTMVNQAGKLSISAPRSKQTADWAHDSNESLGPLNGQFDDDKNLPSDTLLYEADPYRCWYDAEGDLVRWNVPDGYFATDGELFGTRYRQTMVPILDESDPHYAEWERRKAAEAESIELMERVERGDG